MHSQSRTSYHVTCIPYTQAVGFGLVPFMPSVWSLTALYFVICFSYNFTNSAVFTSLGWMFPKRAGSALNLVLAMFGVGSFCIPLAAQACKYLLGSALAVFWVVSATSVLAAIPFLFVASPTPPPPVLIGEGPMVFLTPSKVQVGVCTHMPHVIMSQHRLCSTHEDQMPSRCSSQACALNCHTGGYENHARHNIYMHMFSWSTASAVHADMPPLCVPPPPPGPCY